jgi:hypothetical protein
VEATNKQVETQNGGNPTNNNKSTTTRNQNAMGKDKKKEAERSTAKISHVDRVKNNMHFIRINIHYHLIVQCPVAPKQIINMMR